jgi:hypothetical protein
VPEEAAIPFPQATADPEQAARELANAKRRQRRVRRRKGEATGRGNGTPLIPATKEEAEKAIDSLVTEAVEDITKGKRLPAVKQTGMTLQMKAQIMSVLGDDIEQAREVFANKLLATAVKINERIDREVENFPLNGLGFVQAVCIDKSEALRSKSAAAAGTAHVSLMINQFGENGVDKQKLIDSLLGKFVPEVQAKPVDQA